MGYRSDVNISVNNQYVKDIAKCEIFNYAGATSREHGDNYIFELSSVKFYEEYTDVDELLSTCREINKLEELIKQPLPIAILRVGEEQGDTEDYFNNAWEHGMEVRTEIVYV